MQYNLTRTDGYSGAGNNDTRTSSDFYVDSFPNYNNPNYTTDSYNITITAITWIMGIPQVSTVDISFTRNHININSQYKYFKSNGLVAQVNSIKANDSIDVYSSGTKNYLDDLTQSELNTDGSYNGSFSGTLDYGDIGSSQSSNKVSSLVVSSTVHNLYTSQDYDETFNVAHHRDVTSISNKSTVFGTNRIYELNSNNISDLNSNFYNVHTSLVLYDNSNHEKEIQSHTIPFISGSFTVDDNTYPDICGSFEWNGTLPSTFTNSVYDNSGVGIDFTGSSGNYKWIVYDVDTATNSSFYYLDTETSIEGINVSYIVDLLFDNTIATEFSSSITGSGLNTTNIYVFLSIYTQDAARYHLGKLSIRFQSGANWWFMEIRR